MPAVLPKCGGAAEAEPKPAGKAEGAGGGEGQTAEPSNVSTVIKGGYCYCLFFKHAETLWSKPTYRWYSPSQLSSKFYLSQVPQSYRYQREDW